MPDFCTCGAQLPPDARFCHKCGKPQFEEAAEEIPPVVVAAPVVATPLPPAEISFGNRTAVRIAFMAALIAVLMAVFPLPYPFPRLMFGFLAAGFLAVFLYVRRTGQRLSLRSGARMGWITGIFSFTIFTVQLTAGVLAMSDEGGLAGVIQKQFPPGDARTGQVLQVMQEPTAMAVMMVMMLLVIFVLLTVLPTLGGVLGASVLTREP